MMRAIRRDALTEAKRVLDGIGYTNGRGERADAGETAAFARQLEYIKTQTYDVVYLPLKARQFIPVDNSVPTGAESFTWRQWDWFGMAAILSNFADDLPKVDVIAFEKAQTIKSVGDSYSYTVQDVRAAMMAGTQLEVKKAQAARRAIENKIDALAAFGDSTAGLPGFVNAANVPLVSPTTGGWTTATPTQVMVDLNKLVNSIVTATGSSHIPDTLLLPVSRYSLLATTPFSVNDNRSILKVFLDNSPYIKNIDQWSVLDTGDAARTGPRAVAYLRSPEICGLVIPQEFEQFPAQPKNLSFEIPCHARIGGVSVHYPLGIAYMDSI